MRSFRILVSSDFSRWSLLSTGCLSLALFEKTGKNPLPASRMKKKTSEEENACRRSDFSAFP